MIKRRHVLLTAIAGIAGIVGVRFALSSDEDAILAVLRKRLDYLQLEERGLKAYARDLAASHRIASIRLRWVQMIGPLYTKFDSLGRNPIAHSVRHGEERIVSTYLLSSDFFVNGQDESQIVRYLGFYDPLRACANPFARRMT
jgi:hypothetical protein